MRCIIGGSRLQFLGYPAVTVFPGARGWGRVAYFGRSAVDNVNSKVIDGNRAKSDTGMPALPILVGTCYIY